MAHGHSVDEYLETIYFLAFPVGEYGPVVRDSPALAARVAEMLGVSAPSASEMLKRMELEGLIARGRRKETLLTSKGRAAAERVVRRHRLVERLLTDFMGYTPAESHEHADALGEVMTDDMVERIARRLGDPDRCPHGWPVDPSVEQAENRELLPLSEVVPPAEAVIVRLAEHDGSLLRWFYDQALVPGTRLELERVEEAADQLTVRVDGESRSLSGRAAAGLFVRPLSPVAAG
jgi:DtxR family transcriptional regulator, Mn-dependent transcriptional regulator